VEVEVEQHVVEELEDEHPSALVPPETRNEETYNFCRSHLSAKNTHIR
jgi:hypothetical protein